MLGSGRARGLYIILHFIMLCYNALYRAVLACILVFFACRQEEARAGPVCTVIRTQGENKVAHKA